MLFIYKLFFQNPEVEEASYGGEPEARDLGDEFH